MKFLKIWKNTIGIDGLVFKFVKGSHRDQHLKIDKLLMGDEKFVGDLTKDGKMLSEEYEFDFCEMMEEIESNKVEVFINGDNITEAAIECASTINADIFMEAEERAEREAEENQFDEDDEY